MKIAIKGEYGIINNLEWDGIPEFAILTGKNGVGKSQLLKALALRNGALRGEDIAEAESYTRNIEDAGIAISNPSFKSGEVFYSASEWGVSFGGHSTPDTVWQQLKKTIVDTQPQKVPWLKQELGQRGYNWQDSAIKLSPKNLLPYLTPSIALKLLPSQSARNLGFLFMLYRFLEHEVLLRHTTSTAIRENFGAPPWELLNDILATAELPFEVVPPDPISRSYADESAYSFRIRDKATRLGFDLNKISSGEKVIMSTSLWLLESRNSLPGQKLYLLDEPDAHLHPAMTRRFLNVMKDEFVEKHGAHVIMTTHSPTTVALAPDDSLFVMSRDKVRPEKTNKSQALNDLTYGVPTIAIDWKARRQVFVESPKDEEVYGILYEILKGRIKSERTLEFISSGKANRTTGTHVNTGCDVVSKIVRGLESNGNQSVFGLIDWDLKNSTQGRLHVIGQDKRYALENIILDPLAIAATLLVRAPDVHDRLSAIGIEKSETYWDMFSFSPDRLQIIVTRVTNLVMGEENSHDAHTGAEKYCGGFELKISQSYLRCNCHDLQKRVLDTFLPLKAYANPSEKLLKTVIEAVFRPKPDFIPLLVQEALYDLLEAPSHFD